MSYNMLPYKTKPKYWVSLVTGNKFPYYEYANHGHGGMHSGFVPGEGVVTRNDLPDEYPYTIEFEDPELPLWMRKEEGK